MKRGEVEGETEEMEFREEWEEEGVEREKSKRESVDREMK